MRKPFTINLIEDLSRTLDSTLAETGIVNVSLLSQQIQMRNVAENVALEDIEAELMRLAQGRGASMVFDSPLTAGE